MFLDLNNDLYVYKLPDNLTDEQIDWYFKEYLKVDGTWKYVNDVKIHRRLSVSKYKTLFSSAEFYEDIELIRNYFEKYESREAVWIQMKSFACKFLYAKGMIMSDISEIMKYKNHTSIIYFIKSYKNFTNKIKYEDFMIMVKDGIYPKMEGNTINLIKL
jgi:RNA recognition motif-containing protein